MSLLCLENLSVTLQGTPVVNDVSLTVQPGEIVAITGESGSGKSMTAFATMQLLPQGAETRGRILFEGRDLLTLDETALCRVRGSAIGMVFQEPMTALNPLQTIGAQVTESLRINTGVSSRDARIAAAQTLARVGLPADRFPPGRYPHQLSGGQRQRVVIAMAIARKPRLLIADEPTTALDVTTQAQILDLLVSLARENGMGLVLITHDLAVVAQIADRIAIIQSGQIVESGPAPQILRTVHHPYAKALFEASRHQVTLPPAPPPTPLLEVRALRRTYRLPRTGLFGKSGSFEALRDVSFTLARGERLGLVGESGCGKSTLARALLGLEPVQGGQITLGGMPVVHGASHDPARRRMQVVFQDPFGSFNPRQTVARLICEPFHLSDPPPGGSARQTAITNALLAVGLQPADARKYIHEFSGGQRQRIAIARALITRPDLILFDEAVSALDVSVRARILDLIADLCATHHLTYLFISHDLTVVRSITDRVLVMQAGRIVEAGPTEDVFTKPRHAYTKTLLAAAPCLPDHRDKNVMATGGPS